MDLKRIELDIVIYPEMIGNVKIYSISCLQIPNIVTQGRSIEEAKRRLKEALTLYFEEMPSERSKIIKEETQKEAPLISRIFL